jgi:Tfp pilus assembly protein FimV
MIEIALELLSIPLLLVTAFWCVRVHRGLVALRVGRDEIAEFVETLATATARAERSVQEMKAASGEAAAAQEAQAAALESRRQELQRTIDAAQKMVRRLEDVLGQGARLAAELRAARDAMAPRAVRPEVAPPPAPADSAPPAPAAHRRAADDLLEALQKLR